ncbi:MAG TPA: 3D domain-containing protein [Elusimicrobiota bacterium]|nr:3D domain-containing protein [Elusimicrobiota bacterium]
MNPPVHRPHHLRVGLAVILILSAGGIIWWRGAHVSITVDGSVRHYPLHGRTVADLLKSEHITLGPNDLITPGSNTPLARNMAVKITRVRKKRTKTVETTQPVVVWADRTRANLRRVLVQRGHSTDHVEKVEIVYHDGVEASRRLISRKDVRHPFYTLTLFNNDGFPAATYNLLKVKKVQMLATGYYVGDPMVPGDETRLGYKLQRGLVAVDPAVIPLGTRLYIPGYGYAYAADTGSAIKAMRIDLAVKNAQEEKRYNHRRVAIYILGKARKW